MRIEVEGGLHHVITRGVGRQDIFHDAQDHAKFLALVAAQKLKLPFYWYAYWLMTNHIHLLIERRVDDIGRITREIGSGMRYCDSGTRIGVRPHPERFFI